MILPESIITLILKKHKSHTKRPELDGRLCDHRMEIRVQTD